MPSGDVIDMKLCEMGARIGSGKKSVWVREVRKLTKTGHQTSLISTGFEVPHTQLAAQMFSRWSQENFFGYMMEHFDIDTVLEYGVTEFPETETVVNPDWRELDRARNSLQNKLRYRQARFAELTMHPETEDNGPKYRKWLDRKAELLEEVQNSENELKTLKEKIKGIKKHITWGELPEKNKFLRLLPGRKRLMDTIRMIAYRAETAMARLLRGPTVDLPQARRLLQDLFVTEADVFPDPENKKLNIHVHSASRPAANRALSKFFEDLNNAEVIYPGTDLQLVYHLGSYNTSPHAQGVTETSQR
jgi:regulator of replication initiation timing